MANILKNVDKIITGSGTEVDLDNIQASGGGAAGLEGSGIAYSTDGTDEFYDAGSSSELIALDIVNPQDGEGLVYHAASQTWKNAEISFGPTATGGTEFDDLVNGYKYHLFTESDADGLTMNLTTNIEILLIAGGGGGGAGYYGGGGGAGGLIHTSFVLPVGIYPVQIGGFGAGSVSTSTQGGDGGPSTFHTYTAIGGGGGGSRHTSVNSGRDGGSGGGSGHEGHSSGSGTAGQGNDGGGGNTGEYGGGGGGAGASPVDGFYTDPNYSAHGQNGGVGLDFSDWANATSTGHNGFYAGGGAGGSDSILRTGGIGGGGNGGTNAGDIGTHGLVNTGGGGGGGSSVESWSGAITAIGAGKNGGSGILIIRYTI